MKARFIPEGAECRDFPDAGVTAYLYSSKGRPALLAYKGRSSKPACHYVFRDEAQREDYLMDRLVAPGREVQAHKKERLSVEHGLTVGDVICTGWGYEQTNVNFYEVVRVPSGRSVVLRELEVDLECAPMAMTGEVTPRRGEFKPGTKDLMRRAVGKGRVNVGDGEGAGQLWSGKPMRVSWYH